MKEEMDKAKGKARRAGGGRDGKDNALSLPQLLWGSALPALASAARLRGFQRPRVSGFLCGQRGAATSSLRPVFLEKLKFSVALLHSLFVDGFPI